MTTRREAVAVISAALLPLPFGAHAQKKTNVLFNSFIAAQHPVNTRILKPWAEEISKATGGRVTFEFPPKDLSSPPQQMDGVMKGIFDMAYQFHGFLAQKVKLTQVAHLPFVNTTARGSSIALWRTYEKFFAKADEFKDVHLVGLCVALPGPIFGMKGPINSSADIKGTKIYGLPGVAARMLEAAGGGVVAAPAVRSYEVISSGTVDAYAGYSVMDANAFNTLQYAKHVTDIPGHLTAPAFAFFMNKKKWASIPKADQDIITRFGGEELARRYEAYDGMETKAREAAAAKGIQFSTASEAFMKELRAYAAPLEKAWLDDAAKLGVDGKAALAYFMEQAKANAKA
jgi:TRAP-type C4-dicarboxylate transport system substrate-binding protein